MKIESCTICDAYTCLATDTVAEAAQKLKEKKVRHLYVVDENQKFLGMFSGIDLVYNIIAENKECTKMKVEEVMKKDVTTFSKQDDFTKAFGFMGKFNLFTVPVVEEGKLVGILTYKDVVQKVMELKKQRNGN
jgi:acetoin utilization protein AcuB